MRAGGGPAWRCDSEWRMNVRYFTGFLLSVASVGALERRDVQLDHLEHRVGDPLRAGHVAVAHHLLEGRRDDLPPDAEAIDEPPARLRLAPRLEERVPVAIELRLIVAGDDERNGVVELVVRARAHGPQRLAEEGEVHDLHRARRPARRV